MYIQFWKVTRMYGYLAIMFVVTLIGAIVTLRVANSQQNKEGNPEYDKKTAGYWTRLTVFYVIALVLGFIALLWFITK